MMISKVTGPAGAQSAARAAVPARGFNVDTAAEPGRTAPALAAAAPDGLLLLQEVEDAPARDRRARQHGRALLDALAQLQLGLLGDEADAATLERLAVLAEQCPQAHDPALRAVLADVALRARLELAKRSV